MKKERKHETLTKHKNAAPLGQVELLVRCDWSSKFPTEDGWFWFYGYRFGKISCGYPQKPELIMVRCHKSANGFTYVAAGNFMYQSEVECPNFIKAELPELPSI